MTVGDSTFSMEALKTNVLKWRMFMPSSTEAAIHLGPNNLANLEVGAFWRHSECEYDWQCISFMDEISVFSWSSDPVDTSKSTCPLRFRSVFGKDEWKQSCNYKVGGGQVEEFNMSLSNKELLGIDGEAIQFEWNIFPGFLSLQILQEIQNDLRKRNIEPQKLSDQIIFMSMFNDIDWTKQGNDGLCISNLEKVKEYAKRFSQGHWTFLGPGEEKKWYGTLLYTPERKWDSQMVERFKDTGHPVFQSIRTSNHCPRQLDSQGFANSHRSGTGYQLGWTTKLDMRRTTVLGRSFHFAKNTRFLEKTLQSRAFAALPGGTIMGPVIEVQIVQILDQYGLEIAPPSLQW